MREQATMKLWGTCARWACLLLLCAGRTASAQTVPAEPIVLAGGLLTVGGDVSLTVGPDDPGFFNYTDYEDSVLRMLRFDVNASLRAGEHLSVLGEVRSQNSFAFAPLSLDANTPRLYALYLRIRPWSGRRFDLQVGRIPPTFGAFPRRSYAADNPLIGYPLGYQYLTSLRPDALPADADELLDMRGRGWLANYSVGDPAEAPGVPLSNAFRWDTGVQAHAATDTIELTASVTAGTLSSPRFRDDNSGRQVATRVVVHPTPGLVLGASAARGPFVSGKAVWAAAAMGAAHDDAFAQTAWGGDVEYSRDYYLVRVETIFSRWTIPAVPRVAAPIREPLRAFATSLEGRYKLRPGFYVAARLDRLGFSTVAGSSGSRPWDAPVTRVEAGAGYSLQRNLLLKVTGQFDKRDGGRIRRAYLAAGQLVFWF